MAEILAGKRAFVSGAETGIGRGIAVELARQGADVAVHYAADPDGAQAVVGEIEELGRRAVAVKADFAVIEEIASTADTARQFLGGLDILVNNAGITWNRPFKDVRPDQFDRLYAVNVRGPYFLTQAFLPQLLKSRGRIVNISSIHGLSGRMDHGVYAGTKGAVIAWTRSLAIELASKGVRVNCIAPGAVTVDSYYRALPDFDAEKAGKDVPCGFFAEPDDIAKLCVFLVSDSARFIVGQTIVADGGTTSWMPFGEGFKTPSDMDCGNEYMTP